MTGKPSVAAANANNAISASLHSKGSSKRRCLSSKKNGEREEFSREKLLRGLIRSCEKRPIALEQLETVVNEVEAEIRALGENEVSSIVIGEFVMDKLSKIDDVAYIRFASVYRQFSDRKTFLDELKNMEKKKAEQAAAESSDTQPSDAPPNEAAPGKEDNE